MTRVPFFLLLLIAASISGCAQSKASKVADGKEEAKKLRAPVFDFGENLEPIEDLPEVPYEDTSVEQMSFQRDGKEVPMATFIWAPDPNQGRTLRKSAAHDQSPAFDEGVVHHYLMLPDGKMVRLSHRLSEHEKCELCPDHD